MTNRKIIEIVSLGAALLGGTVLVGSHLSKKTITAHDVLKGLSGLLLGGGLSVIGGYAIKDKYVKDKKEKEELDAYRKQRLDSMSLNTIDDCTVKNKNLSSEDSIYIYGRLNDLRYSVKNYCYSKSKIDEKYNEFSHIVSILALNDSDANAKLVARYRKLDEEAKEERDREERIKVERLKSEAELKKTNAELEKVKILGNTVTKSVDSLGESISSFAKK